MKLCGRCGATNKDANNFCTSCGGKLDAPQAAAAQTPIPQPSAPQPSAASSSVPGSFTVTFVRPSSFVMCGANFNVDIDGARYVLKNNSNFRVPLAPGMHDITISVFGYIQKKEFHLHVSEDMTVTVAPATSATLGLLVGPIFANMAVIPVTVQDNKGHTY